MQRYDGSLDTNVLLRIALNDIVEQHEAAISLLSAPDVRYLVADTAIIEFAFALERHYRFSRAQVEDAITGLVKLPQLVANDSLLVAAAAQYRSHPALSFEDCYLSQIADANSATPLFTFDKKLARQCSLAQLV